ncbi:MAG: hypothetical protein Tp1124SUR272871_53 [Prokaryotic dsDNA virus sp.]|nr:MAG: hypothetical protein Tp1125SUR00d2C35834131_41 [Prokaryotic dsDNA virus sp.]QDP67373.1 MAG: hypothetical protein Tp1124SUR272871_53 [Prokaryotic dsDNA virus sp.]|tara:strand:+ start:34123 stop:34770 length:648 start_codon:yes stop_codon:yes gene_type:complete
MWAKLNDARDTIEEILSSPKSLTINGVKHPRQIFQAWTTAELKAVGIVPVTTSGTSLNSAYYIEKDEAFAIAGDKNSVVRTIGEKAADRKLADEDAVDEDGNKIKDANGNQVINYGLKTVAKEKATTQANGFLKDFDWLIQRKVTADTAIPSDVVTYMAAIRTDHKAICDAIDGASDLDAFIALHTDTYKEDGTVDVVARVNRWTDDKDVKQYRR